MQIQKRKSKNAHTLKLSGDLTIYEVKAVLAKLNDMPEIYSENLKLDMSEVLECDAAGMQLLMYLDRKLAKGCVIYLEKSNELIDSLISLLGLSYLFHSREAH